MQGSCRQFILAAVAAIAVAASIATARTQTGLTLLNELRQGLSNARALPKGSRPAPPDKSLSELIGMSRGDIQRNLGAPSYCDNGDPGLPLAPNCANTSSWSYTWGPPPPPLHHGSGHVDVITGGPWLLIFTFSSSSNLVTAARWQGQR